MSMMAHSIVVMEGDTFRLNVCVIAPYIDFDGDEMNMMCLNRNKQRLNCII